MINDEKNSYLAHFKVGTPFLASFVFLTFLYGLLTSVSPFPGPFR